MCPKFLAALLKIEAFSSIHSDVLTNGFQTTVDFS